VTVAHLPSDHPEPPVIEELIDVIDPADGGVVEQRSRSEVHRLGLWHQVFHCLIVRPGAATVVLQRRSRVKAAFPDKLDLSATGHLEAGESALDGIRELQEELGVEVELSALVPLGTRLLADNGGEGHNRELVHLYLLADDRPLDAYHPAADEVSGLVEIQATDLLGLVGGQQASAEVAEWSPEAGHQTHTIDRRALVDDTNGYWIVVAVMAERFLRGVAPLAI